MQEYKNNSKAPYNEAIEDAVEYCPLVFMNESVQELMKSGAISLPLSWTYQPFDIGLNINTLLLSFLPTSYTYKGRKSNLTIDQDYNHLTLGGPQDQA